jgi:putative DNA primase/helicase
VFNGDESLCRWIQKAAGYTLTGSITEQCFLFLYGHGSNGKSTFLDAIEWILGDYSRRAGEGLLKVSPSGRDPAHEIADLNGTRLSLASELEAGMKLNENLIKAITGDGTLKGRRLYEEAFEFPSTAKLWIAGNHKPAIHGTDNGIWRRVRLVPFAVQFTGQAKDPTLARCFREDEAAGILNWMLEGVGLWQSEGLGECAAIVDAVAEYREESDTLGQFIEETTEHADHWVRLTHSQLFRAYVDWCDEQGMKFKQPSRRLAAMLRERGWVAARTKNGPAWTGRTLKVTEGERTA